MKSVRDVQLDVGLAIGGIICAIYVVWLVVAILLCVWVYRDAQRRGMNGALWLIVVIITGIIGLIIYLIVRKDKTAAAKPSA